MKIAKKFKAYPHLVVLDLKGNTVVEQATAPLEVREWDRDEDNVLVEWYNE